MCCVYLVSGIEISKDYTQYTTQHAHTHTPLAKWQAIFRFGLFLLLSERRYIYHHFDTNYSMALEILQRCIPIERDCLRALQQHD